jgi:hypothetical protein
MTFSGHAWMVNSTCAIRSSDWLSSSTGTASTRSFVCTSPHIAVALPIDPSSLTRWRKRMGEEGVEVLLQATIEAAHAAHLEELTR